MINIDELSKEELERLLIKSLEKLDKINPNAFYKAAKCLVMEFISPEVKSNLFEKEEKQKLIMKMCKFAYENFCSSVANNIQRHFITDLKDNDTWASDWATMYCWKQSYIVKNISIKEFLELYKCKLAYEQYGTIAAVKVHRTLTGSYLKDSNDIIKNWAHEI